MQILTRGTVVLSLLLFVFTAAAPPPRFAEVATHGIVVSEFKAASTVGTDVLKQGAT